MRKQQDEENKPDRKKPAFDVEFEAQKMEQEIGSPQKRDSLRAKEVNADFAVLTAKVETLTKFCKIVALLVGLNLLVSLYKACEL
jgi:hypothetical protein